MNPLSPVPAIAAFVLVACLAQLSVVFARETSSPGNRYATIDDLRGYLAFAVFLHHSFVWYFYLRSGQWVNPTSNLYAHLGESSVTLFFMITGFLFVSKLINARGNSVDWPSLYVSSFQRLVPIYIFTIFLLFVVVLAATEFSLNESFFVQMKNVLKWLSFTIFGQPDINGLHKTWIVVAGVTWSLPYEWFFYLSLPIFALLLGNKVPSKYLTLSTVGMIIFAIWHPKLPHLLAFMGGIAAAFFEKNSRFRAFGTTTPGTLIAILSFVVVVVVFPSAYNAPAIFCCHWLTA